MQLIEQAYVNKDLPKGWKPYYVYAIMVEGQMVGTLILRMGDSQERYIDGHIGYTIDSMYQGHHYAYHAVMMVKGIAREMGFSELIITCDPTNIASKKTIRKLQAHYIETRLIPAHLKKDFDPSQTEKEIYRLVL